MSITQLQKEHILRRPVFIWASLHTGVVEREITQIEVDGIDENVTIITEDTEAATDDLPPLIINEVDDMIVLGLGHTHLVLEEVWGKKIEKKKLKTQGRSL